MDLSMGEGLKWGTIMGLTGLGGILYGNRYSTFVQKRMSVSAKTSVPVMLGVFSLTLAYELTMNSAHRYPERWGLEDSPGDKKTSTVVQKKTLAFHHQIANTLHAYPFQFIIMMAIPTVGFILYENLKVPDLTFSQRIMHSRVYAQGSILLILLPTMAFKNFMDKRGPYDN